MNQETKVCPSCGKKCDSVEQWCVADYDMNGGGLLWTYHFRYADIALSRIHVPGYAVIATRIRRTA